ncbi:MAG: phospholipase D family protein [Gammaproteobacteria bacterium]|nr:phospholipase D family protein [Gammaproteobacteria bacterium]
MKFLFNTFLFLLFSFAAQSSTPLNQLIEPLTKKHPHKTGLYVLEKGGDALLARAWLTDKATKTIDVQYFIWSTDNIGVLAAEALLRAANRGVRVRVLVDDLLIDADNDDLYALAYHPNIHIKIYNPVHSVGVNFIQRLAKMTLDFRGSNQRMHNKMFIVDDTVTITGGRNMSASYFDFGHKYNYRDRDVLLVGDVVSEVKNIFEEFWKSNTSTKIEQLIGNPNSLDTGLPLEDDWGDNIEVNTKAAKINLANLTQTKIQKNYQELHDYANDKANFLPEVRSSISDIDLEIKNIIASSYWLDAVFISDKPGKNNTWFNYSLGGGGDSTLALAKLMKSAKNNIVIQTPYLILSDEAWELFEETLSRGVSIKINTNSLSSSDNLPAYSGYSSQVNKLLDAGVEIYEYRHDAKRRQDLVKRYTQYKNKELPIFSLHAKTMVVDDSIVFIGTFNLDPRSENLNTEVGVIAKDPELARAVKREIEIDMQPGNSWNVRLEGHNNDTTIFKRSKLFLWKLLPIDPIL